MSAVSSLIGLVRTAPAQKISLTSSAFVPPSRSFLKFPLLFIIIYNCIVLVLLGEECPWSVLMSNSAYRLAYKSNLESAKRDRQSSSERARSASERELVPGPFKEKQASDFEKVYSAYFSHCGANGAC